MTTRIHIKNMAGDLFPLQVEPSNDLQTILSALHSIDPIMYPLSRTLLFRVPSNEEDEGDSKEVEPFFQDDEVISVFVSDAPTVEKGVFPLGGQPYVRFVIPIADKIIYLYRNFMYETVVYGTSLSARVTRPSDSHGYARTLYDAVLAVHPDVTPEQMLDVYDIVFPYLEQEGHDLGREIRHEYNPKEPIRAPSGFVVQRSGLTRHKATKKYKQFIKSQKALEA
jgi:hypothetical protein